MSRTAATLTQADIARSIRAAKQAGANAVGVLLPNGTLIRIPISSGKPNAPAEEEVIL